jgi:subtilisin family serine protease/subtilisin-like proprotein convertase family protein
MFNIKYYLVISLIFILSLVQLNAQNTITDYYYYYQGERIYLTLATDAVVVKYASELSESKQKSVLNVASIQNIKEMNQTTLKDVYHIRLQTNLSEADIVQKIDELNQQTDVLIAAPALKPYKGSPVSQLVSDQFIVKFADHVSQDRIEEINDQEMTEIEKDLKRNTYVLRVQPTSERNGLEAANQYAEIFTDEILYAEPDFIYKGLHAATVNDPLHENQWPHENTGQIQDTDGGQDEFNYPISVTGIEDADMDIEKAWDYSTGTNVLISIIDTGVDLDHPDLESNIYNSGWDAAENDYIANDDDTFGAGGHGTSTAGIAAAVGNNGLGVAGVAYDAQILPIRIFDDFGYSVSTSTIASAIDTAWMWGADVLSISWGGYFTSSTLSGAINRAKTQGRGGMGCVILCSSGNSDDHSRTLFPARLSSVIAVGASNMFDEKKNPGSRDGQFWWGGDFGSDLDIVAPTICHTTDIMGEEGYDPGDYFSKFNGTSASAPNAAGIAALIISLHPDLTSDEVQEILEKSADKIDIYPYETNGDNGTYNSKLGYGRVNAHAAVQLALGNDFIPPSIVFTPIPHITSSSTQTLSVTISDESGIGTGTDQPVLYYQVDSGSGFGTWNAITDIDGPSWDVYDFIIPGQSNGSQIQYYVAANDASSQLNTGSFPFGAISESAVGDIPPSRLLKYSASHISEFMLSSIDVPAEISGGSSNTVTSTISVDSSFKILDLNITLAISHTYDSDLIINLTSPSGTFVNLIGSIGGGENNFYITTLDDESSELLIEGSAPFNGTYQPKYPLSAFDGENAQGLWQLTIFDQFQDDGGALLSWSLSFLKESLFTTPKNLHATPDYQQITLTWNPVNDSEVHKYNIYRGLSSPASTLIDSVVAPTPPDTFYLDNNVSNEQVYYYRVTAVSKMGFESDLSNEVHATPGRFAHFVDVDNGDNIMGLGTEDNPWKTITHALTQVLWPGHTIFIANGVYNAEVGEEFPLSMVNGVSLVGAGIDSCIIDADGNSTVIMCRGLTDSTTMITGFIIRDGIGRYLGGGGGIYVMDGSNVNIINNKIEDNMLLGGGDYGSGIYVNNSTALIENNDIINNLGWIGSGISIRNSEATVIDNTMNNSALPDDSYHIFIENSSVLLEKNIIYNTTGRGVTVSGYSGHTQIINNVIYGHSNYGIDIDFGDASIINNTISHNKGGIRLASSSVDSIVNNIITYNTGHGINEVYTFSDPNNLSYNLFQENTDGTYRDEGNIIYITVDSLNIFVPEASYNIAGNPLFVNADNLDFHLMSSSPGIDAGDPNLPFDHEPRPNGCRINVGAYGNTAEATSSVPFLLQSPVSDVFYPEDSGLQIVADLEEIFSICPGFPLDFSIASTNPDIRAEIIDMQIQINSTSDYFGTTVVRLDAHDDTEYTLSDTFVVTIFSVNDAPVIDNLRAIVFKEDSSFVFDLDTMVTDVDHDTTEISWYISFPDNILKTLGKQIRRNSEFVRQKNSIKLINNKIIEPTNIKRSVTEPLSLNQDFLLEKSLNPSEIKSKNKKSLNNHSDSNNSTIGIQSGISDSIIISIDDLTHLVTISATQNFYGLSIPVIFTATDDSGATDSDTTSISVLPVKRMIH